MSSFTLDEMMPLISREANAKRGFLLALFAVVALSMLVVGLAWQKRFMSHTTLYVDDTNIVKPLLEDIAEAASHADKANVARELIFSKDIMDSILDLGGWVPAGSSAVQRERIKEKIIENTVVENINRTLIGIGFYHESPKVAYETTRLYAELFLQKSVRAQSVETNDAFEFIQSQVVAYRSKLEGAEARLEDFKGRHPGARPGTEENVDARIIELRRDLESTELQYAEMSQRASTLEKELTNESSVLQQQYNDSRSLAKIEELQSQIDLLRLSYTDDYPDIIALRQQIQEFKSLAAQQSSSGSTFLPNAASISPVYEKLRTRAVETRAEADSLRSRVAQTRALLSKELGRAGVSSKVERELSELSRDYEINKEIYEEMVKRRENARVSMTLGKEKQGVLYRIQEPANFPVLPSGLRFVHWAAMGLFLGALLPFVLLAAFVKLDPRIRTSSSITEGLDLPLLTVVPHLALPGAQRGWIHTKSAIFVVVTAVLVVYAVAGFIKLSQGVG